MNNKPVAWMHKTYSPNGLYEEDLVWSKIDESSIPLYTHSANPKYDPETGEPLIDGYPLFSGLPPPPAKTLTDDEIQEIAHGFGAIGWMGETTYEFARAILRKAQEK